MTYEEYVQYLRMIATTAQVDKITDAGLARMQGRYGSIMNEIQNELLNYEAVATGKGAKTAELMTKRLRDLTLQSDLLDAMTDDVADMTAAAGAVAYPSYSNMVSWDGKLPGFNDVTKSLSELKEQAKTATLGDKKLRGWLETLYGGENVDDAMRAIIPDFVEDLEKGRLKGEGYRQMVARLRGKYEGYTEQDLTTIARSYTQSMNVQAHTDVYEANKDVVKGVEWTAVLENGNTKTGRGTCERCAALDGQKFEVGVVNEAGAPPCPLHPRCRCLLLPITKTWQELGWDVEEMDKAYRPWVIRTEDAINAGGNRQILDVGHFTGNYGDWWLLQAEPIQNAIVGIQRARLIRNGNLRFTANVGGTTGGYVDGVGDLIPIANLGLDDDVLYFARTGRFPDDPLPPKPPTKPPPLPPVAPAPPPAPPDVIKDKAPTLDDVAAHLKPYQDGLEAYQKETIAIVERQGFVRKRLLEETKKTPLDHKKIARLELQLRNIQTKLDKAFLNPPDAEPLRAFREYIKPPAGGTLTWTRGRGTQTVSSWDGVADEAADWFHPDILDNLPPVEVRFINGRRAGYVPDADYFTMGNKDAGTYIHEFSHHVEWHTGLYPKLKAFRKSRTIGEPRIQVGPPGEEGWADKFYNGYVGKDYEPFYKASEVLSMGVEKMYRDPYGFYLDDPEYFDLTLKAMWNEL